MIQGWLLVAARAADSAALVEVLPVARRAVAVAAPRHRVDAERTLRALVLTLLWARRSLGTVDSESDQEHRGTPVLADVRVPRCEPTDWKGEVHDGAYRRPT